MNLVSVEYNTIRLIGQAASTRSYTRGYHRCTLGYDGMSIWPYQLCRVSVRLFTEIHKRDRAVVYSKPCQRQAPAQRAPDE